MAGLALADMGGLKGRGERHLIAVDGGEVLLIDESYNANPASMAATLKSLGAERDVARRIAVLGPMRELGEHSDALHAGLAPAVLGAHVDRLILIGEEMRPLAEQVVGDASRSTASASVDEATDALLRQLRRRRRGAGQGVQLGRACQAGRADGKGTGMLYLIAEQLGFPGVLNLIRYISFRAGAASATALLIGLLLGPWFISWLRAKQGKGQPIRADGPQSHLAKRGTPTMGGLLILISVGDLGAAVDGPHQPLRLGLPAGDGGFGLIGWLDDYDKVKKAHHAGLSGKTRLALEFLIAGVATWLIVRNGGTQL